MAVKIKSTKRVHLLTNTQATARLNLTPRLEWFNIDYWEARDAVVGTAKGRGTTYFVKHHNHTLVLRRYLRGGLARYFSKSQFMFTGIQNTRPYKELALMELIQNEGLPTPVGVAGCVEKHGLFCSASLLSLSLPQSTSLHDLLCFSQVSASLWRQLGSVIHRFHKSGIYHADLNAHNVLKDAYDQFWIIDFDKCDKRVPNAHWQQKNLDRLLRSLNKEKSVQPEYHFDNAHWQALLEGYGA